jgi:hypothetical protein
MSVPDPGYIYSSWTILVWKTISIKEMALHIPCHLHYCQLLKNVGRIGLEYWGEATSAL